MRKIALLLFLAILLTSCFDDYSYNQGKDYIISFNADGGTGDIPAPMEVHAEYVIAELILPNANLTKDGRNFIGWREPGYTIFYNRPGEKLTVSESMELKAVYDEWAATQLTDPKVTGQWFDSRTYDEYGSGEYGESGYHYILTINSDGSYSQLAHSYKTYRGKTTYGIDFDSPISINKIEYTSSNLIGNESIRINETDEYIRY
jgi:hypothetical protein